MIANNDLSILETIAQSAYKSGLYSGVGAKEKIFMVLMAAYDLGIKPTIALNGGIWNIQGKIEISARLMTSMIRRAGHSLSIKQCDATACIIKGKRADNGDEAEASFTMDDAIKAGLASRDVWKKYTEDMLYSRAISRLGRRLFPDVIGTAYVEGEIRDEQVIDVTPNLDIPEPKPKKETPPVELIAEDKVGRLVLLSKECDPKYLEAVENHLKEMGVNSFSEIPVSLYTRIEKGMMENIKVKKV